MTEAAAVAVEVVELRMMVAWAEVAEVGEQGKK